MQRKPWETYRVGKPSDNPNWTNPLCQPLKIVSHVAHIPNAIRILEDQQIKADLVYDESKLRIHRIQVVWLSPNYWRNGFRYGNAQFIFDWEQLITRRRYYWVESIEDYNPTACRILVSYTDFSNLLLPYNPNDGDGPWWYDQSTAECVKESWTQFV